MLPKGSVSFFHKSARGLHPQTEFVFDLRLPDNFKPQNKDGEVEDFKLVTSDELLNLIQSEVVTYSSIIPFSFYYIRRNST